MTLRDMMIELILFSYDPGELIRRFHITEDELDTLCDQDLLELYDQTLLQTF